MKNEITPSTSPSHTETMTTTTITTTVAAMVSRGVGQWTLRSSLQTSVRNWRLCGTTSFTRCSRSSKTNAPIGLSSEGRARQDSNLQPPDLESGALAS